MMMTCPLLLSDAIRILITPHDLVRWTILAFAWRVESILLVQYPERYVMVMIDNFIFSYPRQCWYFSFPFYPLFFSPDCSKPDFSDAERLHALHEKHEAEGTTVDFVC